MEITDEMRMRARDFGQQMPDYLAALQRARPAGELEQEQTIAVFSDAERGGVSVTVERWGGVVRPSVYAYDGGEGCDVEPAYALRAGWDLIAAGDAVRYGWLT